jgi:hypothetical protein
MTAHMAKPTKPAKPVQKTPRPYGKKKIPPTITEEELEAAANEESEENAVMIPLMDDLEDGTGVEARLIRTVQVFREVKNDNGHKEKAKVCTLDASTFTIASWDDIEKKYGGGTYYAAAFAAPGSGHQGIFKWNKFISDLPQKRSPLDAANGGLGLVQETEAGLFAVAGTDPKETSQLMMSQMYFLMLMKMSGNYIDTLKEICIAQTMRPESSTGPELLKTMTEMLKNTDKARQDAQIDQFKLIGSNAKLEIEKTKIQSKDNFQSAIAGAITAENVGGLLDLAKGFMNFMQKGGPPPALLAGVDPAQLEAIRAAHAAQAGGG